MSADVFLFYLMGAFAVAGALGMVLNVRNTVASALSLVIAMISLGGIYVLLQAHLIAVIHIMVYAGAIVVLFLFGTGPIKGFAVTLSLGIVTSMFTAIMGTRAVVNLVYGGKKRVSKLAI